MLDMKRREFTALVGCGGLLLTAKVRRARAQQPAIPVIGFLSVRSPGESASERRDGGYYRDVPAVKVWNGPLIA